jgi:hypothetical protein
MIFFYFRVASRRKVGIRASRLHVGTVVPIHRGPRYIEKQGVRKEKSPDSFFLA